jgi:hypothetical protein
MSIPRQRLRRQTLLAFVCGAVLASASVGLAATAGGVWQHREGSVLCRMFPNRTGAYTGECRALGSGYSVQLIRNAAFLLYGGRVLYSCLYGGTHPYHSASGASFPCNSSNLGKSLDSRQNP